MQTRNKKNRQDASDVAQAFDALYAGLDPKPLLEVLAEAIKFAHQESQHLWCWEVTAWPGDKGFVRFNVGRPKECLTVYKDGHIKFCVEREHFDDVARQEIRTLCGDDSIHRWKRESQKRDSISVTKDRLSRLHDIYDIIRTAHQAMIKQYTEKPWVNPNGTVHSKGFIEFLRQALSDPAIPNPDTPLRREHQLSFFADDTSDEVREAIDTANEQAGKLAARQGFRMSSADRKAIEDYAMKKAICYYRERGWETDPSVASTKPYDLKCVRDGVELHVEVKGTTSNGSQVILTNNEVEHARAYRPVALFIVAKIRLTDNAQASGGDEPEPFDPWMIDEGNLVPISYVYSTPALSRDRSNTTPAPMHS